VIGELEVTYGRRHQYVYDGMETKSDAPETSLFSNTVPSGNSILLPSFATMMTVPLKIIPRPNVTSPATVKWSSSRIPGMDLNRFWNAATCGHDFVNSSTVGGDGEAHLLEVVAELDDRSGAKHSLGVHDELSMLERVEIGSNQEEIGATLDGQELSVRRQ
jgi:hypothetical protein